MFTPGPTHLILHHCDPRNKAYYLDHIKPEYDNDDDSGLGLYTVRHKNTPKFLLP